MNAVDTRALIVDDDPFALRMLVHQLNRLGVRNVRCCSTADEALVALGASEPAPNLLFCDLNMPGMDGVEFVRHLSGVGYAGGLVVVSGADARIIRAVENLARAHALNVLASLHKPVAAGPLQETLARHVGAQQQRAAPEDHCDVDELRSALAADELVNYYQPQVEIASGRLVGVEALVRWKHPREGLLLPHRFIATAEASGLIENLTQGVLRQGVRDLRGWRHAGLDLRLAVNVSMRCLDSLRFPDEVVAVAESCSIPNDRLVIEVTESNAVRKPKATLEIASRLRLKHIGLSIDDFGTGYASLEQLRDLPFDELKIDRGFVHRAGEDPVLHAILQSNVTLAQRLDLRTVAEGVETREDLDCVRRIGCEIAQGFLIARPMPEAALIPWAIGWMAEHAVMAKAHP